MPSGPADLLVTAASAGGATYVIVKLSLPIDVLKRKRTNSSTKAARERWMRLGASF